MYIGRPPWARHEAGSDYCFSRMNQALLLFAKVPRPGSVKTRLTPVLTPSEAARLYTAFLWDTLRHVLRLDVDVRLYLAPPIPDGGIEDLPSEVRLHEQKGDGLAVRLDAAFRETFDAGYERVVVLGTDHPTLPPAFVRQAFRALEDPRSICIGPTRDGGFYLLGMNAMYSRLFEDMSYSHPRVFSETLARADQTSACLTVLPRWYDVDTPEDLDRLRSDLSDSDVDAPNSRQMMAQLGLEVGA